MSGETPGNWFFEALDRLNLDERFHHVNQMATEKGPGFVSPLSISSRGSPPAQQPVPSLSPGDCQRTRRTLHPQKVFFYRLALCLAANTEAISHSSFRLGYRAQT